MRPLDLKLLRDLGAMKGQMAAVAMVMACGLMVMIMERGLVVSLETSRDAYYQSNRLADLFCDLKRAPNSLRVRLSHIPGIAVAETRVKGSAVLDIPGMKQTAEGTLLSLPEDHPQHLNLLYLRVGRLPVVGNRGEVVVSDAFAEAHGFMPGDTIDATIYGARERLHIVGIALSPEYVYALPPGSIMPDNRRYGVFWMSERELAVALDLEGAFNNVVVDVAPGGDPTAVKADLDRILAPYGGLTTYDRTEQLSVKMVNDEIKGLRTMAVAFPLIFLSIAAFMTSAALSRLVHLQREQIAQLKAFGYSSRTIGWHYCKFALVVVCFAFLIGGVLGMWFGSRMLMVYHPFFRFPVLNFHPDWPAFLLAVLASAATSFLGVLGAVRHAVTLPPAEAMRPEPPAAFRASLLERIGLQNLASTSFRMALRNLERKPWQALFTTLGLAMATAIPIVSVSMGDGMDYMMDFQWRLAQRQDVTLALIEPGSFSAINDIRGLPGVLHVEPFRAVEARLYFGHHKRRVAITGLPQNVLLSRVLDVHGEPVALPLSGLLLSKQLAKMMFVQPGDALRVEVLEGRRPVLDTTVSGTITDFAGVGAWMDIDRLHHLMRESRTVSGANLTVDSAREDEFFAAVKDSPRIGAITTTRAARENYDKMMGKMIDISRAIFFFFAVVVAFGVIYNGAHIALSERARDLATLRVMGFTQREVATILIGELSLLTLLALLPGLYIGSELTSLILTSINTETMRIPVVLTSQAYATAVLIVLLSSALSFTVVSRHIVKLDLLGVLKARE